MTKERIVRGFCGRRGYNVIVCETGDVGDCLYIIYDGLVSLSYD